jgi:hypothetical protein
LAARTFGEDAPDLASPCVAAAGGYCEDLTLHAREDTTLAVAGDYTRCSKEHVVAVVVRKAASVLDSGTAVQRADGGLDHVLQEIHSGECDETVRCPLAYSWVRRRTAGGSSLDTIHVRRFRSDVKESRIDGQETVLVPL